MEISLRALSLEMLSVAEVCYFFVGRIQYKHETLILHRKQLQCTTTVLK